MAIIFASIPVPAANGSGAAVDVSTFGCCKTITLTNDFIGSVTIEISNEPSPTAWAPLTTFTVPDGDVFYAAVKWMRATVSGYKSGAPLCDIGGSDDGATVASLPVTAGNGSGSAIDVSGVPLFKTVTVGGVFTGGVQIEVSENGTTKWSQIGFGFGPAQGGQQSAIVAARYMRATRSGVATPAGTPVVSVAGTSISGNGGGGGGGGVDGTVVNLPTVDSSLIPGEVIYSNNGVATAAQANGATSSVAVGLVMAVLSGVLITAKTCGPMTLATAQWDAVTGQTGGLTPGVWYYLSPSTPGYMTVAAPATSGQYVVPIGQALTASVFNINIQKSVLL